MPAVDSRVTIHRYWEGPPPSGASWTKNAVQSVHPAARIRDWTYTNLPQPITEAMMVVAGIRQRSNFVRYALLHTFGGLWLDNDVLPLADLTTSATPWTASLGGHREGSTLWFPQPKHALLAELLEETPKRDARIAGAKLLHELGLNYPLVAHEPRVLPYDATGRRVLEVTEPMAVHLWATSKGKHK